MTTMTARARVNDIRVLGDDGDDSFTMGAAAESAEGGAGNDSVNYYKSDLAVTVYLDDFGTNGGGAKGDAIFDVEQLSGSVFADHLLGSDTDNFLYGNSGADSM